jgi:Fe-S oxidoreductase
MTFLLLIVSVYAIYQPLSNIIRKIQSGSSFDVKTSMTHRIMLVVRMIFLQERLLQDKVYGLMHLCFLYGFFVLSIGHVELLFYGLTVFLEDYNYVPFLYMNISFVPTSAIHMYNISQDFFAFMIVIVSFYALYRRIILQYDRLMPRSKDAEVVLWFIITLYMSFFLFVSSELCLVEYELLKKESVWLWMYPVSSLLTPLLINNLSHMSILYLNKLFFFLHLIIFLGFACYVPRSKHMHLIFAWPNIFVSNIIKEPIQKLKRINFEEDEEFGVNNVKQFSWKELLNSFACTECGRCNEVCPAHLTQKPLKPKKVVNDIKLNLYNDNDKVIQVSEDGNIGEISTDEIWACTTCGACAEVCPVLIDSVPSTLIDMRRYLVLTEANYYPKELNPAFRAMENQNNPWGIGNDKRADWAEDLDVKIFDKNTKDIEYLLFVGCASSTDEKAIKSLKKFILLLNNANISFAILGTKENCCGDPARRMGNEYLYEALVEKNIEQFNKYNIKKILTTCPHCYNQLKNEYRDFKTDYTVRHHAEFILELIRDNKIKIKNNNTDLSKSISTFHDPCYMGRYNRDYTSSRNILQHLSINISEMPLNKEKSFCCGAGGGRMFMEEHNSNRINKERINQAKSVNAVNIVAACPFCKTMLTDGIDTDDMHVIDIAEVVADNLK